MTRSVGIYLFDEVEVLDFAGPFEVFSTASRVKLRFKPESSKPFEVFTIADSKRTIYARGGLMILPQYDMKSHPAIDILIVPGGVVTAELQRPAFTDWVDRVAKQSHLTASVCTGAFLLAKAGLLDGKQATTHWEDIQDLHASFPGIIIQEGVRWVDSGSVITSAGISAGIDMSLYLVARLEGEDLARRTARQMEFDWDLHTSGNLGNTGL